MRCQGLLMPGWPVVMFCPHPTPYPARLAQGFYSVLLITASSWSLTLSPVLSAGVWCQERGPLPLHCLSPAYQALRVFVAHSRQVAPEQPQPLFASHLFTPQYQPWANQARWWAAVWWAKVILSWLIYMYKTPSQGISLTGFGFSYRDFTALVFFWQTHRDACQSFHGTVH